MHFDSYQIYDRLRSHLLWRLFARGVVIDLLIYLFIFKFLLRISLVNVWNGKNMRERKGKSVECGSFSSLENLLSLRSILLSRLLQNCSAQLSFASRRFSSTFPYIPLAFASFLYVTRFRGCATEEKSEKGIFFLFFFLFVCISKTFFI